MQTPIPARKPSRKKAIVTGVAVLVCALVCVHSFGAHTRADDARQPGAAARAGEPGASASGRVVRQATALVPEGTALPEKTAAMRAAILAAARSGSIEALRTPLEWNEILPEIAPGAAGDPIALWKRQSADGEGREILARMVSILESQPAVIGAGTRSELYVWPGFAELDLTALTPAQEVQLYRLLTPAELVDMRGRKAWSWYRLAIGPDGTWHSFLKAQ